MVSRDVGCTPSDGRPGSRRVRPAHHSLLELAAAGLASALEELINEIAAAEAAVGPQSWADVEAEMRLREAYNAALARLHERFPDAATPADALARANISPERYGNNLAALTDGLEAFLAAPRPVKGPRARSA